MSRSFPTGPASGPGPEIAPSPGSDSNGHTAETSTESPSIWVVNNRSAATVRSRFFKSLLLGVSCAFQLAVAGEVLSLYGPMTFLAFALGILICSGIAAQEMGALLSAIDMRAARLKEVLWDLPWESGPDDADSGTADSGTADPENGGIEFAETMGPGSTDPDRSR